MSVYYKFKSNLNCDKVTFDGLHISVGDLKRTIMQQKKIGKSNDFDLQITNAQTKEVYTADDMLIQKNTTIVVSRVPLTNTKKHWKEAEQITVNNNISSHIPLDKILKSSALSNLDETEEEKIKTMMTQSTQDYDSSKFVKTRSMVGPVPPNYTCYRCGKGGHFIKHCPTNQNDVKRSTGIPRSFMMPASADQKGALITPSGEYVVPIIDHQAYKETKKEKPPFIPSDTPELEEKSVEKIPDELQCQICTNILQDAVMIPCCGNSYCDECIRTNLLESEQHECPTCHSLNISPDSLLPNRYLRNAVLKYKNENKTHPKQIIRPALVNNYLSSSNNNKVVLNLKTPLVPDSQTKKNETQTEKSAEKNIESNLCSDIIANDKIIEDFNTKESLTLNLNQNNNQADESDNVANEIKANSPSPPPETTEVKDNLKVNISPRSDDVVESEETKAKSEEEVIENDNVLNNVDSDPIVSNDDAKKDSIFEIGEPQADEILKSNEKQETNNLDKALDQPMTDYSQMDSNYGYQQNGYSYNNYNNGYNQIYTIGNDSRNMRHTQNMIRSVENNGQFPQRHSILGHPPRGVYPQHMNNLPPQQYSNSAYNYTARAQPNRPVVHHTMMNQNSQYNQGYNQINPMVRQHFNQGFNQDNYGYTNMQPIGNRNAVTNYGQNIGDMSNGQYNVCQPNYGNHGYVNPNADTLYQRPHGEDYEDALDKFAKQLEERNNQSTHTRSVGRSRSKSRNRRSRSNSSWSRSSRSSSYSSASSRSTSSSSYNRSRSRGSREYSRKKAKSYGRRRSRSSKRKDYYNHNHNTSSINYSSNRLSKKSRSRSPLNRYTNRYAHEKGSDIKSKSSNHISNSYDNKSKRYRNSSRPRSSERKDDRKDSKSIRHLSDYKKSSKRSPTRNRHESCKDKKYSKNEEIKSRISEKKSSETKQFNLDYDEKKKEIKTNDLNIIANRVQIETKDHEIRSKEHLESVPEENENIDVSIKDDSKNFDDLDKYEEQAQEITNQFLNDSPIFENKKVIDNSQSESIGEEIAISEKNTKEEVNLNERTESEDVGLSQPTSYNKDQLQENGDNTGNKRPRLDEDNIKQSKTNLHNELNKESKKSDDKRDKYYDKTDITKEKKDLNKYKDDYYRDKSGKSKKYIKEDKDSYKRNRSPEKYSRLSKIKEDDKRHKKDTRDEKDDKDRKSRDKIKKERNDKELVAKNISNKDKSKSSESIALDKELDDKVRDEQIDSRDKYKKSHRKHKKDDKEEKDEKEDREIRKRKAEVEERESSKKHKKHKKHKNKDSEKSSKKKSKKGSSRDRDNRKSSKTEKNR